MKTGPQTKFDDEILDEPVVQKQKSKRNTFIAIGVGALAVGGLAYYGAFASASAWFAGASATTLVIGAVGVGAAIGLTYQFGGRVFGAVKSGLSTVWNAASGLFKRNSQPDDSTNPNEDLGDSSTLESSQKLTLGERKDLNVTPLRQGQEAKDQRTLRELANDIKKTEATQNPDDNQKTKEQKPCCAHP